MAGTSLFDSVRWPQTTPNPRASGTEHRLLGASPPESRLTNRRLPGFRVNAPRTSTRRSLPFSGRRFSVPARAVYEKDSASRSFEQALFWPTHNREA